MKATTRTSRMLKASLTLALSLPLLTAALGCDDCEERCQQDYDDCKSSKDDETRDRCDSQFDQCMGICVSQPREDQR